MRRRRLLLTALAAGLVATTMTAHAATVRKVCYLLKDDANDGRHASAAGAVLKSPALDIRSADIATGKKTLVGTLRMTTTDTTDNNSVLVGVRWYLNFVVQGKNYSFERSRPPGQNPTYSNGFSGASAPTMKVTMSKTAVTWTIPRSVIPGLSKSGAVISGINAQTAITGGNADAATTANKYKDKTPSCLAAS